MVTGVLIALIAATLLRMTMLRYQMGGRSALIMQEKRDDQQLLASIVSAWNSANGGAGQTCANVAIANYTQSASGSCGCSYAPTAPNSLNLPTITTAVTPNGCQLTIVSVDRQ